MKDFFENESKSKDQKRDVAFQTLSATRDALNLAVDKTIPVTYEQAFAIIQDLDPTLYKNINENLKSKNENDELKLYKEIARTQSLIENRKVNVEDLLEQDIKKFEALLKAGMPVNEDDSDESIQESLGFIKRKIAMLVNAKMSLQPRRLSENRIILRDYSKIDRSSYFGERFYENDDFIDYKLSNNRHLRIRLLHPDKPEHITGADLIYEQIDFKRNRIRFIFLQYKTWDEKGIIYFSESKSILEQIDKMKCLLCDDGFCKESTTKNDEEFRFPFCSGFWRPTDKIQDSDSKLISTGFHIPVCKVLRISKEESKIEKNKIRKESVTHKIFEELFCQNLIGSDWVSFNECEDFYKKHLILHSEDRIRILTREFREI